MFTCANAVAKGRELCSNVYGVGWSYHCLCWHSEGLMICVVSRERPQVLGQRYWRKSLIWISVYLGFKLQFSWVFHTLMNRWLIVQLCLYCWCDAVASQLERPWKAALNRNYSIGTVCCGGSERVAADKQLQREQAVLVSGFPLRVCALFSLRKLHAACCSFLYSLL